MRFFRLLLLTAVISVSLFSQEKAPEIAQSGTVIRSNPRLVLVNIVATDSSGRPVHGLKQRDFTVLEDGKTQSLRAFEEHRTNTNDASMPPSLNLGPNVHTNFVPVPKDSVTNILLFDVINMSSQDLVSAKAELLKTVENLPPGQQFALFVLGSRLRMIQGFTWDKDAIDYRRKRSQYKHQSGVFRCAYVFHPDGRNQGDSNHQERAILPGARHLACGRAGDQTWLA
jgi:VWFA-related protein